MTRPTPHARCFADELLDAILTYGPPVALGPLAPLDDPDAFELATSVDGPRRKPVKSDRPADLPNQSRMF